MSGRIDDGVDCVRAGVAIAAELGGTEGDPHSVRRTSPRCSIGSDGRARRSPSRVRAGSTCGSLASSGHMAGSSSRSLRRPPSPSDRGRGRRIPAARAGSTADRPGGSPAPGPALSAGHVPRRPRSGRLCARGGAGGGERAGWDRGSPRRSSPQPRTWPWPRVGRPTRARSSRRDSPLPSAGRPIQRWRRSLRRRSVWRRTWPPRRVHGATMERSPRRARGSARSPARSNGSPASSACRWRPRLPLDRPTDP